MTDLGDVAAIILALGVVGERLWKGRIESQDRGEAKAARVAAAAALADIGKKVDGATEELKRTNGMLRADKEALKTEVARRDEPGALPTNDSPGPVSIDAAGAVNVAGEDRRR